MGGKVKQVSCILSVDIGGTRTKYGLVDPKAGKITAMIVRPTETAGLSEFLVAVAAASDALCSRAGISRRGIVAAGLGVPGFVSGDHVSLVWDSLSFLEGTHLRGALEKELGLPVRMDNDARTIALGEARWGRHGNPHRMLSLTLGTGVGFGFTVGGRLQEMSAVNHLAGHILIRPGARPCFCGFSGCLESLVNFTALEERFRDLCRKQPDVRCDFNADAEGIFSATVAGHPLALQAVRTLLEDLTAGLNVYINLFAPDVFVLGGGLSKGLKPFLSEIHAGLVAKPFDTYKVRVSISRLGERAGIYGAASLWEEEAK
jgi:glucokinase